MSEPEIRLTYDGGDAAHNSIDMRLLGISLQGADRILSDILIITSARRLPKKGERAPLILKIKEPRSGSYDLVGYWQDISSLLPLGLPIITAIGTDICSNWVQSVLLWFTGRQSEAMKAVEIVAQLQRDHLAASDRTDERRHVEAMGMQQILMEALQRLGPAAVQYAAPVGRSVDRAIFRSGSQPPATLDVPGADEIRKSAELEWTPIAEMTLRTDGFKFHSLGLSVEHPDRDGYLMAKVSDPQFEKEENPYTEASQRKAVILVLARKGYRGGALEQIDIVEFVRETDA